jgi:GDP-mannose 4,6 dehydratase/DegT/DnrJ/EryC1/StrS aminotransferase family
MTDFYADRHILITGGLGFIGSNSALELIERGAKVTLLDSMIPSYGATVENIKPIRDRVTVSFSDVRDSHSLPYVVRDQGVIFCLAGQVSHIESMQRPLVDLDINCRSQLSLLECCRRVNPTVRLVFAGTRQIYGKPQFLPVTESHPLDPTDVNGVNKLAAEMYYMLYAKIHGMSTITLQIDHRLIKAAVTPATRCVIPIHLYGYPAPVQEIEDICVEFIEGKQVGIGDAVVWFGLGNYCLFDAADALSSYTGSEKIAERA